MILSITSYAEILIFVRRPTACHGKATVQGAAVRRRVGAAVPQGVPLRRHEGGVQQEALPVCGVLRHDARRAPGRGEPRLQSRFQRLIVDYIERRKSEVSGSTINITVSALKHFFEMNDAEQSVNWAKVSRLVPKARRSGSDRAPTTEEIRQMVQAADIRTRCVILTCASSGIRVGAFEGMCWGDVTPVYKEDGDKTTQVRAARLVVYRGHVEEYVTFVTPECYDSLMQYRSMREGIGEAITARSPLIRDAWDNHRHRKQAAKDPKVARPLTSKAIANMVGLFLRRIRFRDPGLRLSAGGGAGNHYEFKQVHGFRKYFKTNAERYHQDDRRREADRPRGELLQALRGVPCGAVRQDRAQPDDIGDRGAQGQDAEAGRGQRQEGGRDRAQERGAAGQAEQAGVKLRLAEGHPGGRHPGEDQAAARERIPAAAFATNPHADAS